MSLIRYLKGLLYFFISLLILVFITTILSHFNLIDENTTKYFKIFSIIIPLFISGLYIGNKTLNKRFIEGIKIGLCIVVISIIISLLTKTRIVFSNIIYYLIMIFSSMLGSMIAKPKLK